MKIFSSTTTLIIILWLKRINTLCDFCGLLSMYLRTIKNDTNICFINSNTQREQVKYLVYYLCSILERHNLCFLKKVAHAYFKRRIFSKSFGGKIRQNWTDVTYRMNIEYSICVVQALYILFAFCFFFCTKNIYFKLPLTWVEPPNIKK